MHCAVNAEALQVSVCRRLDGIIRTGLPESIVRRLDKSANALTILQGECSGYFRHTHEVKICCSAYKRRRPNAAISPAFMKSELK